jgi:Xaa-Pro aminopeptidase
MHEARLKAAERVMVTAGAEALLVLGLVNIRYLTGFTGSDGALLLVKGRWHLLCDSRYTLQAYSETTQCVVVEYKVKADGITSLLIETGCSRLVFDAEKVPVSFYNAIVTALPATEFVPLADELDQLRTVKTSAEIAAVEHSALLASTAFQAILPLVRPGVTERYLALELELQMRRLGADNKAFDFIVVSGERGALPHGSPTDRMLQSGEFVTFDFGACSAGYHSDETVTVAVGSPDENLLQIHRVVKDAHDQAIAAVAPGMACSAVDAIARQHIVNCGYGEYFGHGLGHGVGLEVHEKPTVSSRSTQYLQEGMIITIEPGIYVPGLGGVRIEDLLVVTATGCRVLSGVDKELLFC